MVKISDFGVAKMFDSLNQSTQRFSIKGSIFWMAPEIVRREPFTSKADIWSLGCLVLEMVTGQHPWNGFDQIQALYQIGIAGNNPVAHLKGQLQLQRHRGGGGGGGDDDDNNSTATTALPPTGESTPTLTPTQQNGRCLQANGHHAEGDDFRSRSRCSSRLSSYDHDDDDDEDGDDMQRMLDEEQHTPVAVAAPPLDQSLQLWCQLPLEAQDFVEQCLILNHVDRPDARTMLCHPFVWMR